MGWEGLSLVAYLKVYPMVTAFTMWDSSLPIPARHRLHSHLLLSNGQWEIFTHPFSKLCPQRHVSELIDAGVPHSALGMAAPKSDICVTQGPTGMSRSYHLIYLPKTLGQWSFPVIQCVPSHSTMEALQSPSHPAISINVTRLGTVLWAELCPPKNNILAS